MTPVHHPSADLLAAYAAGTSCEAESLVIATHATLCPPCRSAIERYEALGGTLLQQMHPAPVGDLLAATLARLDEPAPPRPAPVPGDAVQPRPLRAYTGAALEDLDWRPLGDGMRAHWLPLKWGGVPAHLLEFQPGLCAPRHGHTGIEHAVVLVGGYDDEFGTYRRGDMATRTDADQHELRVHDGGVCVSLLAVNGIMVPAG